MVRHFKCENVFAKGLFSLFECIMQLLDSLPCNVGVCVMKGCGCNTACASLCLCSLSMWPLMLQQVFWVMCDCMSLTAYYPSSVRASHQAKGRKYSRIPWLCLVFSSSPCWAECLNLKLRHPCGQPMADRHTLDPLPAREAVVQSHEKVQRKA